MVGKKSIKLLGFMKESPINPTWFVNHINLDTPLI